MKKLVLLLSSFLLLTPMVVFGATASGWSFTNLLDGFISPNRVNGVNQGIRVSASSTIGAGGTGTGLTIFGSATTTGTHIFQNGFISQASSTFTGNASTTGSFYAGTATSTNLFGAGLSTCNGANQALNWASGLFSCATISAGGATNLFTSTTYGGVFASGTSTQVRFTGSPFSIVASTTFWSYASTSNFEMTLYANEFSGSDIGAKVNAAYAALPSIGGRVVIPAGSYSFSTAISCNTSGKPMFLEGTPGSTNLTYTGSATSTVFNCGGAYDTSGYLRAFGIYGINITGPSTSGTSVGIEVGGTNTNQGFTAEKVVLSSFGKDLAVGNNVWIAKFSNMGLYKSTLVLSWEATSNAGEDITYEDVIFDGGTAPRTCINSNPSVPYASVHFVNSAFDDCQVNLAAGTWNATFTSCHWENPTNLGAGTEVPYYYISMATSTDSQATVLGGTFVNNANATAENPNAFIYAPSNIVIDGLRVVANGGALEVGNFVIDDRQSTGNVEIKSVYNSKNNYGSGPGRAFTTIFNGNASGALGNGIIAQWSNRNGSNGFGILPLTNGNVDFINASSSVLTISSAGLFGVGTTTPGSLFSVNGITNFTTATSTFYGIGGINISGGCFSVNNTCIGGGATATLTDSISFDSCTPQVDSTTFAPGGAFDDYVGNRPVENFLNATSSRVFCIVHVPNTYSSGGTVGWSMTATTSGNLVMDVYGTTTAKSTNGAVAGPSACQFGANGAVLLNASSSAANRLQITGSAVFPVVSTTTSTTGLTLAGEKELCVIFERSATNANDTLENSAFLLYKPYFEFVRNVN